MLDFELYHSVVVSHDYCQSWKEQKVKSRKEVELGDSANLLKLIHQVGGVGFNFIVGFMKTPCDDLTHYVKVACDIGDSVSSNIHCSIQGVETHTSRQ
jgi:hypothetical protein